MKSLLKEETEVLASKPTIGVEAPTVTEVLIDEDTSLTEVASDTVICVSTAGAFRMMRSPAYLGT